MEASEFRDYLEEFAAKDFVVLGISGDSMKSHQNFKTKMDLNYELLSDPSKEVHEMFDVIKLKKSFGKEYMGTVRSTFIINKEGVLVKAYRKAKSKGHAEEVLTYVNENF